VRADLLRDDVAAWSERLAEIDAVVNAAGVLRGDLEQVHRRGAAALFDACAEASVSRLPQISALGAGEEPMSRFLVSKQKADEHMMRLARARGETGWCVLRPSLVIGRGGASTALFCSLAALPRPIRLGPGFWLVQPIQVADLVRVVADLLESRGMPPCLALVGAEEMTTDGLTLTLRAWLGLPPACQLTLPEPALKMAARLGDALPGSNLTRESLAMLAAGNTADLAPMVRVLGWAPRLLADALAAEPATN
jgi:nucleoside-diphosphate-sugar epimerase